MRKILLVCMLLLCCHALFAQAKEPSAQTIDPSAQTKGLSSAQAINLSGKWTCTLLTDQDGKTIDAAQTTTTIINLPGTTDTNLLGYAPTTQEETTHLTRLHAYKGKAKYERDIFLPKINKKNHYLLFLERTKTTEVYIDGTSIGTCNHISTPQRYTLPYLKAGRHRITIIVDNASGVPQQVYGSSHAYTEDTQTNWNGIIGQIYVQEESNNLDKNTPNQHFQPLTTPCPIKDCFKDFHADTHHFYANGKMIFLRGKHDACVWPLTGHVPMDKPTWTHYMDTLQEYGINHIRFHSWCPPEAAFAVADSLGIYLQPELPFWGDFNAKDTILMTFLHQEGMNILKEYAHHPSFVMMALGNELWGSIEQMKSFTDDFRQIAPHILYTFGSNYYLGYQGIKSGMDYFTTCRIGGEAWGNYDTHTRGSFSYADAYEGGMINHFHPSTLHNFDTACDKAAVPIISHETGQFQTYPDYAEIKKYTGVLYPYNMEVFRTRLQKAGMTNQAEAFHQASGRWSALLYKADIEMDLRTRNMAGFQLLDIQDYPGQGSAYVGILDAFMQSKGIITPKEWRQWCNDVVPMWETDRFCYADGDTLKGKFVVANYGGTSLKGKSLLWTLQPQNIVKIDHEVCPETDIHERISNEGTTTQETTPKITTIQGSTQGSMPLPDGEGLLEVGLIANQVLHAEKAAAYTLTMTIPGTDYTNSYQLWIYPTEKPSTRSLIVTNELTTDIAKKLERGAKVLFIPLIADNDTVPGTTTQSTIPSGLFTTDYWNYRMFKTICTNNKKGVSPGTLGILTDPHHPLFKDFPTEYHTNWQWYPIVKIAHPLILDHLPSSYSPIVQVIDNIERNHKLGLIMEFAIGKGKLVLCMSDLNKASSFPEGNAFYHSVLDYMRSTQFTPSTSITLPQLQELLTTGPQRQKMKELNNISQY